MAYLDQYELAQDLTFRKKIYVAQSTAAVAVAGESQGGMSSTKYGKRQALAQLVLRQPQATVELFAFAVTQNAAVAMLAPVNISSSTNAFPSVVTTASAHGLATGDTVRIADHVTNTAINGDWTATNITSTTFSVPVQASGAGGATGRIFEFPLDSDIQFTVNSVWDDIAGVTALD